MPGLDSSPDQERTCQCAPAVRRSEAYHPHPPLVAGLHGVVALPASARFVCPLLNFTGVHFSCLPGRPSRAWRPPPAASGGQAASPTSSPPAFGSAGSRARPGRRTQPFDERRSPCDRTLGRMAEMCYTARLPSSTARPPIANLRPEIRECWETSGRKPMWGRVPHRGFLPGA